MGQNLNKLGKGPDVDAYATYHGHRPVLEKMRAKEIPVKNKTKAFWACGHYLNKLGRIPLCDSACQISKFWAL